MESKDKLIFRDIKPNLKYIKSSIKSETLPACIYNNIISTKEAIIWFVDHQLALERFSTFKRSNFISNLFKYFDAVAFTDGAWSTDKSKGGIGGFIYSKNMFISIMFFQDQLLLLMYWELRW